MLVVPASKKFKFINAPAINARTVAKPRINPSPTKNLPHGIKMPNKPAFGTAKLSRNVPYQPSPVSFAIAPCRNPQLPIHQ